MSDNTYHLGDTIRVSARFELAGVLTDPTTVSLYMQHPEGGVNYTAIKDSVGLYHYDCTPTVLGSYEYVWRGYGAVVAVGKGKFKLVDN